MRAFVGGVPVERAAGAVDPRVVQVARGDPDARRGEVVVRHSDGVDDPGAVGVEGDGPEPEHRQVDHRVTGRPAGCGVGVRGRDDHVPLVIGVAELRGQASQDLLLDGLEDQPDLGGHVDEPG